MEDLKDCTLQQPVRVSREDDPFETSVCKRSFIQNLWEPIYRDLHPAQLSAVCRTYCRLLRYHQSLLITTYGRIRETKRSLEKKGWGRPQTADGVECNRLRVAAMRCLWHVKPVRNGRREG